MAKAESIPLTKITRDPRLMMRQSINADTLKQYIEVMTGDAPDKPPSNDMFPPVKVAKDKDGIFWLVDGWHRVGASESCSLSEVACEVVSRIEGKPVDWDDIVELAAGANADNRGLQRTVADKRKALVALLALPRHVKTSDVALAVLAGVSHTMVSQYRKASAEPTAAQLTPGSKAHMMAEDQARRIAELEEAERKKLAAVPLSDAERKAAVAERIVDHLEAHPPPEPPPAKSFKERKVTTKAGTDYTVSKAVAAKAKRVKVGAGPCKSVSSQEYIQFQKIFWAWQDLLREIEKKHADDGPRYVAPIQEMAVKMLQEVKFYGNREKLLTVGGRG